MQTSLITELLKRILTLWVFQTTALHHTAPNTHTTILRPSWILSRTTLVSRRQKGKTMKVKSIWIYWSKREPLANTVLNTISLVSRRCIRREFLYILEDVCSLHTCFSANPFRLLCCITPCEYSGRFYAPPGTYRVKRNEHWNGANWKVMTETEATRRKTRLRVHCWAPAFRD